MNVKRFGFNPDLYGEAIQYKKLTNTMQQHKRNAHVVFIDVWMMELEN